MRAFLLLSLPVLLAAWLMSLHGMAEAASEGESIATTESAESLQVVEGDILVAAASHQTRAIGLKGASRLWPDGIVPYRLDAGLSASGVIAVNRAIEYWNRVSGITLMSLDEEWSAAQSLPSDSVLFQPGQGCASWVGRRGGEQEVWVAVNCNAGSMMHEIGHLLGLEHEHTRPDRDQYIDVHWENINPDKLHNFDKAPDDTQMLGDYDYESIMHYGPMNFSVNGEKTLSPLVDTGVTMGQRLAPSAGDVAAVATLYAADLAIVTSFVSESGSSEISLYVSNNGSQGAHSIEVEAHFGGSRLLSYSGKGWQCQSDSPGRASCALARLAGGSTSPLLLALSGSLSAEEISANVSAKTPDDDPANNADGASVEPSLGAASALDDASSESLRGGAAFWLGPMLWVLLLLRQASERIDRQAGDRVKRIRFWGTVG